MWPKKLAWYDKLPTEITTQWNDISFTTTEKVIDTSLDWPQGYCDASEKDYGTL